MTPNELALDLGIDGKRLRNWLRTNWPPAYPHQRWDLSLEQVDLARQHFGLGHVEPLATATVRATTQTSAIVSGDHSDGDWSLWAPLLTAAATASQSPGVYMARQGESGPVVYVGMAGERRGQGIRGRLKIYSSGKGLASGLGEAVMDRAFADATWIEGRLAEIHAGTPRRAKHWGIEALAWANLQVRWQEAADRAAALTLERQVLRSLPQEPLWNRAR